MFVTGYRCYPFLDRIELGREVVDQVEVSVKSLVCHESSERFRIFLKTLGICLDLFGHISHTRPSFQHLAVGVFAFPAFAWPLFDFGPSHLRIQLDLLDSDQSNENLLVSREIRYFPPSQPVACDVF